MNSTLEELLEKISVLPTGQWQNDFGPKDWLAVCDESGIIAYFGKEKDAYFFRMALINARLSQ